MLAGFAIFIMVFGFVTFNYVLITENKKAEFWRWAKMSINFDRKRIIETESKINQVDPDLFRAIIWIESQGDSAAISPTGCRGIGQINKGNAKTFGHEHEDMHKDEFSIPISLRLIKESRDYYFSNKELKKKESLEEWILREYNVGRGVALKNFLAGKSYAKLVLLVYRAIKDGSLKVKINNKLVKIDLAKINGEA